MLRASRRPAAESLPTRGLRPRRGALARYLRRSSLTRGFGASSASAANATCRRALRRD